MSGALKIRNWDQWQSYRKDRGHPPWIKVHRALMRDPSWVNLTDSQRGQLVSMWMLAADRGGLIPDCPYTVKQLCFMKHKPDLQFFIDQGFIENPDAKLASGRRQDDAPETEERRDRGETDVAQGADENVSQETSQSVPVESPKGQPTKYVFESGVIKLNPKNFKQWETAFSKLDLRAELISLTAWANGFGPNDWFVPVSQALGKRNREQKTKIETAKAPNAEPKWRSGMEGVV